MEIGNQIKKLRNRLNMSQESFGARVGVSGKTISAYETSKIKPTLEIIEKISVEFNVFLITKKTLQHKKLEEKIQNLQNAIQEIQNLFKESLLY
jgi:transcriptional regulator with XRE-family HTH domain